MRKYIGAYAAAMGDVDVIAFTGGIGENSASMRRRVCDKFDLKSEGSKNGDPLKPM